MNPGDRPRPRVLLDHFALLQDDRESWRAAHPLPEVLLLLVCGTIGACDDPARCAGAGRHRREDLARQPRQGCGRRGAAPGLGLRHPQQTCSGPGSGGGGRRFPGEHRFPRLATIARVTGTTWEKGRQTSATRFQGIIPPSGYHLVEKDDANTSGQSGRSDSVRPVSALRLLPPDDAPGACGGRAQPLGHREQPAPGARHDLRRGRHP